MNRPTLAALAVAALIYSPAACGTSATADGGADTGSAACPVASADCHETGADPTAGPPSGAVRCLPEAVDCVDTGGDERDAFLHAAADLLGRPEADVPPGVRVSRHGDTTRALTDDTVVGRRTVELDDTDGSGYRVVAVTVELPDGPERLQLTPG